MSIGHAGGKSDAPLLYYYSTIENAFVIERGDGSEQRILTEFTIPQDCYAYDYCHISGPGWSPSGMWFAWTVQNNARLPVEQATVNIVDRTGNQRLNLEQLRGVESLQWSPTNDLLLIERYTAEESGYEYYLWRSTLQNPQLWLKHDGSSMMKWLPSGDYLVVYSVQGDETNLEVFDTEGALVWRRVVHPLVDATNSAFCVPQWSTNDTIAYIAPNSALILENLSDTIQYEFDFIDNYLIHIDWDTSGEYAIVYSNDTCDYTRGSYNLSLISLPDQMILNLSPSARLLLNSCFFCPSTVWAEGGRHGVYFDQQLHPFTASPLEIYDIDILSNPDTFVSGNLWHWFNDDVLAFYDAQSLDVPTISVFNFTTGVVNNLLSSGSTVHNFFISPENGYIALPNYSECRGICIVDILEREEYRIESLDYGIEEVFWDPTEHWFFFLGNPIGNSRQVGIAKTDGTIVRRLPDWYDLTSSSGFGWMPAELS